MKTRSVKSLLIVTSAFEGATGLALLTIPSLFTNILLGSHLNDNLSIIITRVAGAALVSIALVCWYSRKNESVSGLLIALLFYNLAATVLLGYAGLFENLAGIVLWPAVATHIILAAWGAKLLYWNKSQLKIQ